MTSFYNKESALQLCHNSLMLSAPVRVRFPVQLMKKSFLTRINSIIRLLKFFGNVAGQMFLENSRRIVRSPSVGTEQEDAETARARLCFCLLNGVARPFVRRPDVRTSLSPKRRRRRCASGQTTPGAADTVFGTAKRPPFEWKAPREKRPNHAGRRKGKLARASI